MSVQLREVLAYLDSIQSSYPTGVPVVTPAERELLFVAVSKEKKLSTPELELLNAAVLKGLELSLEQIEVSVINGTDHNGVKLLTDTDAKVVIGLGLDTKELFGAGDSLKEGDWCALNGKEVLITHTLSAVINNKSIKREFWEHLKQVKEKIACQ